MWDELPYWELSSSEIQREHLQQSTNTTIREEAIKRITWCPFILNDLERKLDDPFFEPDDVEQWMSANWEACEQAAYEAEEGRLHRAFLRNQRHF